MIKRVVFCSEPIRHVHRRLAYGFGATIVCMWYDRFGGRVRAERTALIKKVKEKL